MFAVSVLICVGCVGCSVFGWGAAGVAGKDIAAEESEEARVVEARVCADPFTDPSLLISTPYISISV
jgi:hypothetical protein